ncbi:MarR family transcriptional regulator [Oerskovia turbata]|uniref:MarR family transcriptional regulator n=1 Tax=Oerskovia turbata TaxID=1713 RepID=A0A4Q1KYU4_9CELL|nr:MarR family winged helix-turn-helix transcriptional regulator [Oerskovia turbata]RXR26781.1 MarR family transcriptional regulator [Oerskovia turbata]RXR34514.1 MarR family transcriptional regulator [Oerskovia turbata]TGJ97790.1 MarR family transcriptional regulator [Actinotalea fermentans ATCC 43279 = JCM 9966 = DSM 3133]
MTSSTTSPPTVHDRATTREAAEAWESLFRTQVALMRRFQADDIWDELTMREYDVLFTLAACPGGGTRLRDLNEHVLISQPSLSRMAERLEQRGLVERVPAPDDARGTIVRLTPEGARLQKEIGRRHVRTISAYVGGALDADELATLKGLLDKLRGAQGDIPARDGSAA